MGRGLSALQKTILRLALEAHDADRELPSGAPTAWWKGMISCDEVLVEHWQIREPSDLQDEKKRAEDPVVGRRVWARRRRGSIYRKYADYPQGALSPGEKLYRYRPTLSRALRRLELRGLIWHKPDPWRRPRLWIHLTGTGLEAARNIRNLIGS